MKKALKLIILAFIFSIIVCGCSVKSKYIKDLSFKEFKQKIDNKDSFVLYIGNDHCSHCNKYMPTLKKVLEDYKVTIYHIDNRKLKDDYIKFKEYINISGTPTIVFIENGDEETTLNRIVGEKTYDETVEMLKVNDYIK